ncbi:MAG: flagellar protein FlaG protein [Paenibacillus sp.]|nr:flagellar protein FlaG protein [Paenibacillus sp.]
MNLEMSIGGEASRSLGAERAVQEPKVKTSSSQTEFHSVKELKQAELQGDQITISDEQLIRAVERAIKAMEGTSTSLEFSIHDQTKKIMVKVKDRESGEVIRELPPEKSLDFLAKVWEMAGLLFDEKR